MGIHNRRILVVLLSCAVSSGAQEKASGKTGSDDPLDHARALLDSGKRDEANTELRKILAHHKEQAEREPKNAVHPLRMGQACFYLDEDRKAIEHLQRARELDPKYAHVRYMIGAVLSYRTPVGASAHFDAAAQLDPKNAEYQYTAGYWLMRARRPEKALRAFQAAIKLNPEYFEAHYNMGVLLTDSDTAKALGHFEKALQIDGKHINSLYNVAQLHYNAGQFGKALENWAAARAIAPEDLQITKKVIQAHYALGQYDEARPVRETFLKLHRESQDPQLKSLREFCFDQFKAGEYHVMAFETIQKTGFLYYHFTFHVSDKKGQTIRTVQLETSKVIQELGVKYVLGKDENGAHSTLGPGWTKLPDYAELKKLVIEHARKTPRKSDEGKDADDR